jgi:transcriptional regulator with XRE-family HTH domain
MEQTPPSRLSDAQRAATARAFADWLTDRMRDRGYALPPHGRGGVRRLAERARLSPSVISTLLRGENPNPSPESLRAIADALGLPFPELLIRAGIITPEELHAIQDSTEQLGRPPITIAEAAASQGIDTTDPVAMEMFEANVRAVRELQQRRLDRERAD